MLLLHLSRGKKFYKVEKFLAKQFFAKLKIQEEILAKKKKDFYNFFFNMSALLDNKSFKQKKHEENFFLIKALPHLTIPHRCEILNSTRNNFSRRN